MPTTLKIKPDGMQYSKKFLKKSPEEQEAILYKRWVKSKERRELMESIGKAIRSKKGKAGAAAVIGGTIGAAVLAYYKSKTKEK